MDFKWNVPGKANDIKDILTYIMKERNFTKEQMLEFINNKPKMHDPFLFKDMQKVVDRIKLAIYRNEKICIVGD